MIYAVSDSKVQVIQNSHLKSFPAFITLTFPFTPRFLLLFMEMALILPSETDSCNYHRIVKNCFSLHPSLAPLQKQYWQAPVITTQLQKRRQNKSTDRHTLEFQFLPWSLAWLSLLLSNPKINAIMLKSLVVKSSSCQAANYSLMQKAEATKTKCTSTQCKLSYFPSFPCSTPNFWSFLHSCLYSFLKGTPKESAFKLLRLSHRSLGKMTWKSQH